MQAAMLCGFERFVYKSTRGDPRACKGVWMAVHDYANVCLSIGKRQSLHVYQHGLDQRNAMVAVMMVNCF